MWTYHLVGDGRTRRCTGLIPKIGALAILTTVRAQMKLDRMSREVPLEAPWTAKRAAEWDSQTGGRVHCTETETSTTSHGAMDGAVRAGERAARRGPGAR